jgi:hypothetical protein
MGATVPSRQLSAPDDEGNNRDEVCRRAGEATTLLIQCAPTANSIVALTTDAQHRANLVAPSIDDTAATSRLGMEVTVG